MYGGDLVPMESQRSLMHAAHHYRRQLVREVPHRPAQRLNVSLDAFFAALQWVVSANSAGWDAKLHLDIRNSAVDDAL